MKKLNIFGLLIILLIGGYVASGKIRYALYVRDYQTRIAAFEENRSKLLGQLASEMDKASPRGFKLQSDMKTQQVVIFLQKGYRQIPKAQQAAYRQGLFDLWKSTVHSNQLKDLKAEARIEDPFSNKIYEFKE